MALHARLALLVAVLALPIQPGVAQGFLDSLFGSDGPSPSRPASGYVRSQPAPGFAPSSLFEDLFSPFPNEASQPHERSTYRTLCVRMCDGFYFPISYATSSTNLMRDAEKCTASCGSEARLFYHPSSGGDVDAMLDMTGRAYASYPTAFKYRKTLVQGCQCRPQPWTETERERHRAYAAAQPPGSQAATPIALPNSTAGASPGIAATDAIARPDAIQRQTQAGQWDWFFDANPRGQPRSVYSRPGIR